MVRLLPIALAQAAGALAALRTCGPAQYDPAQYVCWSNQFLCPIVAGEPLSYCGGACYSKFMYTCASDTNTLATLPKLTGTPFKLTVVNPALSAMDGQPVSAVNGRLILGGPTGSYCPTEQVGAACPAGNITALVAHDTGYLGMKVMVPGGQQAYLTTDGGVAYTQAHSAYIPPGSTQNGFVAYRGGGFFHQASGSAGWVACPPRRLPAGEPLRYSLFAQNTTTADGFATQGCTKVNLKVEALPETTVGAWQYT